jgi:hypothetical protein
MCRRACARTAAYIITCTYYAAQERGTSPRYSGWTNRCRSHCQVHETGLTFTGYIPVRARLILSREQMAKPKPGKKVVKASKPDEKKGKAKVRVS